jgi:putative transcriptional regulator
MSLDYNFFDVEKAYAIASKGKILISEPFLDDTYFKRSIVLLTEHSQEGSVGFVLNKPVGLHLHDVLEDFPQSQFRVSMGGPVNTDSIHYIHTLGNLIPDSLHVYENIYWGGDFEAVKEYLNSGILQKDNIKFFLGYSGWSPSQLDEELRRNSWIVTHVDATRLMKDTQEEFWKEMLKRVGKKYKLWAEFPENPRFN